DRLVAQAAGWTCHNARRDRPANFGNRLRALTTTRLQILPVFCRAYRSTACRAEGSSGCNTCTSPSALTQNLMVMVLLLRCAITRRRSAGASKSCANQHGENEKQYVRSQTDSFCVFPHKNAHKPPNASGRNCPTKQCILL